MQQLLHLKQNGKPDPSKPPAPERETESGREWQQFFKALQKLLGLESTELIPLCLGIFYFRSSSNSKSN
jgi:hypothetical protein